MGKSRDLAAFLNFFLWGLGYLYLRKRVRFGIILLFAYAAEAVFSLLFPEKFSWGTGIAFDVVASFAFAYDAYNLGSEDGRP